MVVLKEQASQKNKLNISVAMQCWGLLIKNWKFTVLVDYCESQNILKYFIDTDVLGIIIKHVELQN